MTVGWCAYICVCLYHGSWFVCTQIFLLINHSSCRIIHEEDSSEAAVGKRFWRGYVANQLSSDGGAEKRFWRGYVANQLASDGRGGGGGAEKRFWRGYVAKQLSDEADSRSGGDEKRFARHGGHSKKR